MLITMFSFAVTVSPVANRFYRAARRDSQMSVRHAQNTNFTA